MTDREIRDAIKELYSLTKCRCGKEWTSRGLHSSECNHDYRKDVLTIASALVRGMIMQGSDKDFIKRLREVASRIENVDDHIDIHLAADLIEELEWKIEKSNIPVHHSSPKFDYDYIYKGIDKGKY